MEGKKSKTGHYNSLIWLLMSEYKDKQYTPTDYIVELYKDYIQSTGLSLHIHDSTLYDFKVTKGVKEYLDELHRTTSRFSDSLLILSYTNNKYITRDCYIARLAKLYTCWDIAYINCPNPKEISTKVFNYIISNIDIAKELTNIIEGK